eukprot:5228246-Amphidinium_carterae.1
MVKEVNLVQWYGMGHRLGMHVQHLALLCRLNWQHYKDCNKVVRVLQWVLPRLVEKASADPMVHYSARLVKFIAGECLDLAQQEVHCSRSGASKSILTEAPTNVHVLI